MTRLLLWCAFYFGCVELFLYIRLIVSTHTHTYTSYLLSPGILQELVTHFLRISLSSKTKN